MHIALNMYLERHNSHFRAEIKGVRVKSRMWPAETEPLKFKTKNQPRIASLLRPCVAWNSQKKSWLDIFGQLISGVWVWIFFFVTGSNSNVNPRRKPSVIAKFFINRLRIGSRYLSLSVWWLKERRKERKNWLPSDLIKPSICLKEHEHEASGGK